VGAVGVFEGFYRPSRMGKGTTTRTTLNKAKPAGGAAARHNKAKRGKLANWSVIRGNPLVVPNFGRASRKAPLSTKGLKKQAKRALHRERDREREAAASAAATAPAAGAAAATGMEE